MTPGRVALLLGLFAVPAVLLWAGHRLRRRSPGWRGAFWGAVLAHTLASLSAMAAAMWPPVEWGAGDRWRGLAGFWLMLLAAPAGAALGYLRARRAPPPPFQRTTRQR
jgi:hypothetical protein